MEIDFIPLFCAEIIFLANNGKKIAIYMPNGSRVELIKDSAAPRSHIKGVIDFVHYLRYRNSITGFYQLKAKKFKELKNQFFSQYDIVEAAGGIVINGKGEILIIRRRGYWDLPKGKFSKGESKRDCALREVMEETGVQSVKVETSLDLYFNGKKTTYHTYRYKRRPTIKPVYWYIMRADKQKLTPQTDEDIDQAIWVKEKDLENYYDGAYPAIKDIFISVKEMKL